ncbi:GlcNAc-PI de-N-acetylase [Paractinoplanes deccanensis]|uniref:GlcNAc-PI de-N-acetylase n=1 Tax=Paractinoplanes deccanensis TaxID=113561 RepID=A0ABQ3YHF6_9ACTN|nr:PIG-L family deacetylase [Actinoplanes deccanensis]GID79446.1 GlcNAc-PI de-N-acetylase [Actinoplanes deccanensis]
MSTLLGIWAHPDDEAYLSGGLMALAAERGDRVVCVTATRGERGTNDPQRWPPERLAAERTAELARSLRILGVTEHHWLGYPDGGCLAAPAGEAIAKLAALIGEIRPDTVVTFGPDGNTGHADHRTVARWAAAAFARAAPGARLLRSAVGASWHRRWAPLHEGLNIFEPGYPVVVPDEALALGLVLDDRTARRKVRALAAQRTQTAGLLGAMGLDRYTEWVREETFVGWVPPTAGHEPCPACWWDLTTARWQCAS